MHEASVPPGEDAALPRLAVVVLSYANEDTIVAAVGSLLAQDVSLEIVVSHSGGGRTPALLAEAHPKIPVLTSERRRLPGEARNVGAAATRAPWVAFLEGDSFAAPGWAAARLARHEAGAVAVSGAVAPDTLLPAALAAHLQRNRQRMSHMPPPPPHLRYTVSLERGALERHGPFPEHLPRSEDTAMNNRLIEAGVDIAWTAEAVLVTTYPRTAAALWREQMRRARIFGSVSGGLPWRVAAAAQSVADAGAGLAQALRPGSRLPRSAVVRALPHIALCAAATAIGRARGDLAPPADQAADANAARRARIDALKRRVRAAGRRS